MTFTLVNSDQVGFADGNTGHVYTLLSGAPAVGDWDVLCVNSDTTVTTPSGWTAGPTRVVSQGAYIYTRKATGGEGSTVTITTVGNFPTHLSWVRVSGADAVDVTNAGGVDATFTNVTPVFTSSSLSTSNDWALAFAAIHNFTSAAPTGAVWSTGYTAINEGSNATGATAVYGAIAYKTPAGTAAESPSVSWTNNARNRYLLFVAFTAVAGGSTINGTATVAGTGSAVASAVQTVKATTAGAGAVTTAVTQGAKATVTAAGTLASSATQRATAAVAGASAVTAAVTESATAALAGAGSVTAAAGGATPGTASLAGAGTLSTASATLAGAALPAAGAISATATVVVRAAAALAGAGALTSPVRMLSTVSPVAAGALTAVGMVTAPDISVPGSMTVATAAPRLTPTTAGPRLISTTSGGDA